MRLPVGTTAPTFAAIDFLGQPVDLLALRGRPVMLSFYRYAGCPVCNLRMRDLIAAYPLLAGLDLSLVAVFQSPATSLAEYVGRQDAPFPIVGDPDLVHYRRWGVEANWRALLNPASWRHGLRAMVHGFRPGRIEGSVHRYPADFLIGADGHIARAHYGRDIGDHLPLTEIETWLLGSKPARAVAAAEPVQ